MSRAAALVIIAAFACPARAQEAAFWRGNELFAKGDHAAAAAAYEEAIREGGGGFALHFNLGNACLLAGRHGAALHHYRIAERFAPRDEDLAANLAIARSRRSADIAPPRPPRAIGLLLWPLEQTSPGERLVAFIACFGAGVLLLHLRIVRPSAWVGRAAVSFAFLGVLAGATILLRGTGLVVRPEGVVLKEDAEVRTGPSADVYPLHFRLPEGAEVEVLERREDGWVKIAAHTASGEQKGYLAAPDIGLVDP